MWSCSSDQVTEMTSVAAVCWGLVFWEREGTAYASISGPETATGTAPVPEGAEALADRLVRAGTLVRDPLVTEVRRGHRPAVSARTIERRFRAATGLTRGSVRQIERVRTAATLLAGGTPAPRWSPDSTTSTSRTWPARCVGTSGVPPDSSATAPVGALALNLDQATTS